MFLLSSHIKHSLKESFIVAKTECVALAKVILHVICRCTQFYMFVNEKMSGSKPGKSGLGRSFLDFDSHSIFFFVYLSLRWTSLFFRGDYLKQCVYYINIYSFSQVQYKTSCFVQYTIYSEQLVYFSHDTVNFLCCILMAPFIKAALLKFCRTQKCCHFETHSLVNLPSGLRQGALKQVFLSIFIVIQTMQFVMVKLHVGSSQKLRTRKCHKKSFVHAINFQ